MKLLKDKKGFTLVELLIALVLIGLLTTAAYGIFSSARRYNMALDAANQRQQLINEVIYRLRVELSDAGEAEAFDPVAEPGKIDFTKPENDDYYYLVYNNNDSDADGVKDGGFLYYGFDSSGVRVATPEKYGTAMSNEFDYYCKVVFTTDTGAVTGGASKIEAQIIKAGDATETPIVTVSSDIRLRSVAANGVGAAIRFKKIS